MTRRQKSAPKAPLNAATRLLNKPRFGMVNGVADATRMLGCQVEHGLATITDGHQAKTTHSQLAMTRIRHSA